MLTIHKMRIIIRLVSSQKPNRKRVKKINTLKFYRLNNRLTMKEMAEKIGVSPSTYSYIEKGEITASEEVVKKIADVLDISTDTIFYPAKFRIRELKGSEIHD